MASTMDEQLLQTLRDTQSSAQGPRKLAEAHLEQLQVNEAFPTALATIASHTGLELNLRQAALLSLRRYVDRNWSGQDEEISSGPVIVITDASKEQLRGGMLELATSNESDRKIKSAARYVWM
jgi:hypothetical protein